MASYMTIRFLFVASLTGFIVSSSFQSSTAPISPHLLPVKLPTKDETLRQTFYITSTGNPARDVAIDGPLNHSSAQRRAERAERERRARQQYGIAHVRLETMTLGRCFFAFSSAQRLNFTVTNKENRAEYNSFVRNVAPNIRGYSLMAGPNC